MHQQNADFGMYIHLQGRHRHSRVHIRIPICLPFCQTLTFPMAYFLAERFALNCHLLYLLCPILFLGWGKHLKYLRWKRWSIMVFFMLPGSYFEVVFPSLLAPVGSFLQPWRDSHHMIWLQIQHFTAGCMRILVWNLWWNFSLSLLFPHRCCISCCQHSSDDTFTLWAARTIINIQWDRSSSASACEAMDYIRVTAVVIIVYYT